MESGEFQYASAFCKPHMRTYEQYNVQLVSLPTIKRENGSWADTQETIKPEYPLANTHQQMPLRCCFSLLIWAGFEEPVDKMVGPT